MKICICGHNFGKHHLKKHRIEGMSEGRQEFVIYNTRSKMFILEHAECSKCSCKHAVLKEII